ncbi:hypothetical protein QIH87_50230 (plasmid) [Bradyrhizobium elkanii]|uniref:hypothetical protein n=1 Tax=Bradyrhizobium elkanii TaxID=29448 RepID=UPI002715114A|nr:hypothetical protein [Bradyrhizobium elkanii]WLB14810.1 hypothetical protein QIH87_50230 [Bradyrhizobium elkanii]WLB69099.1 hypothetical protein QIH89_27685 [Bradyrhizobium elkanii]
MSKKRRSTAPVTARSRTETAEVSHPRVAGKTEFVERVVDTLTTMFNRRQISQLQYGAGDRYRTAHDMTSASSGGSMDFDRVRGGSGVSPTPALSFLMAAETVREARHFLYPRDFAIVHRVCAQGFTIEQAARQLYDERFDVPWAAYLSDAGRRFRTGLDELADRWWPDARTTIDKKTGEEFRPRQGFRTERADQTDAPAASPSPVAHGTKDKVYWSNEKRRARA